ncbi:MAG: LysR family transcriptional regulator [Gammaproteobacteria bacterium]
MPLHITMRQIQVFEAVVRHRSFTRAARELHLTQPAVSMQVKQLQAMLGLPLFESRARAARLTGAGRAMLRHSRAMMAQLAEIERDINILKGGSLKICIASTINRFARLLLAKFRAVYKSVHISLDVAGRAELIARLERGADAPDLALMERPPPGVPLEARAFMLNPLIVIATPRHPLARRRQIPLTEIAAQPVVMREPGTRTAMTRVFDEHGVRPAPGMRVSGSEIAQNVAAGLGLAVVSAHAVELELSAGRVVALDLRHFPIMRKCYVAYRKGKALSPPAMVFLQFALSEGKRSGLAFAAGRA